MLSGKPEAFSRILIDKALEASEWDLLDSRQVRFEHNAVDDFGRTPLILAKTDEMKALLRKYGGK